MNAKKAKELERKRKKCKEELEELIKEGKFENKLDSSKQLLYDYFSINKKVCQELEQNLFENYTSHFIEGIRTSQAFLYKERFEFLSQLPIVKTVPKEFVLHQEVWQYLYSEDKNIWNKITTSLVKISNVPFSDIISQLVFWIEEKRFIIFNDFQSEELVAGHLRSIYSFFITLYLHNYPEKSFSDNSSNFYIQRLKKFLSEPFQADENLYNLLDEISNWIPFNQNRLQSYCFEDVELQKQGGIIFFNKKPINHYRWKLDGVRYNKFKQDYNGKATSLVDSNKKLDIRLQGVNDENKEVLNRWLAIRIEKTKLVLRDLCIENFVVGENKVNVMKAIRPMLTFAFDCDINYERPLDDFKRQVCSYKQAISLMTENMQKSEINKSPCLILSTKEFCELYKDTFSDLELNNVNDLINIFSYSVKPKPKHKFNRYKVNYDVLYKPFIKIKDKLFCPMAFFANNDWFFAAIQAAILNVNKNKEERKRTSKNKEERKRTSDLIENYLAKKFKEKGFRVKVISREESNRFIGDIDIIIEDKHTLLVIQFKRTYLRFDLKDAYNEVKLSENKAFKQVSEGVKSLLKENEIYKVKNNPVKWLVSTSFENILKEVDDCKKINYFELLNALEKPELKTLNDIIVFLEKDKQMEHDLQYETLFDLPLKLDTPKHYCEQMSRDVEYDVLLEKAQALLFKDDKKAIEILKQYLNKYPNDCMVYNFLGICYSSLKDKDNMINSFEKALELIPNEPYIKRNYALAMLDFKEHFKGLKMLLELSKDYTYYDGLYRLFYKRYGPLYRELSENERDELEKIISN